MTTFSRWVCWTFSKHVSCSTICLRQVSLLTHSCGCIGQMVNTEMVFSEHVNLLDSLWRLWYSKYLVIYVSVRLALWTLLGKDAWFDMRINTWLKLGRRKTRKNVCSSPSLLYISFLGRWTVDNRELRKWQAVLLLSAPFRGLLMQ